MTVEDPSTCCLLISTRDHPLRMWDICTQTVRCSYSLYNHVDEILAPHSLSFHPSGQRIYAGCSDSSLRVIDLQRSGSDCCLQWINLGPAVKGFFTS
jgi:WD40 repeat protein